jgi:hypothetical protein
MGAPRAELVNAVRGLYDDLRTAGAKYSQFDLGDPWKESSGDDRKYVFIPYKQVMEVPGRGSMHQEAFFIGVSTDTILKADAR